MSMRLDLCFWKHANSRAISSPLCDCRTISPNGFVWAAYSAPRRICPRLKRRIFPGVIKRAYGQILAENNKQMLSSSIEVNVDAVPRGREKLSIQLFIPNISFSGRTKVAPWSVTGTQKPGRRHFYIAKKNTAEHMTSCNVVETT